MNAQDVAYVPPGAANASVDINGGMGGEPGGLGCRHNNTGGIPKA